MATHYEVPSDWTFELIGPKVQSNPYKLGNHILIPHGRKLSIVWNDYSFDGIKSLLSLHNIEGIVWWMNEHYIDSKKAKIKRKDFGLTWPLETENVYL